MEITLSWMASLVLFILPAYLANSSALYLDPARHGRKSAPIDGGRNFWDGRRIFGDGKTWDGLFGGVATGLLAGAIIGFLGLAPLGLDFDTWLLSALFLALGTHAGDLLGSFIKRRLDVGRGGKLPVFDQLGFAILGLLFASFVVPDLGYRIGVEGFLFLLVLTYLVHIFFNWFAYRIGLKDVPW